MKNAIKKLDIFYTTILVKIGISTTKLEYRGLENSKLLAEVPDRLQFNLSPSTFRFSPVGEGKNKIRAAFLASECTAGALDILEALTLDEREGMSQLTLVPSVVSQLFSLVQEYAKENGYEVVL